MYISSINLYNSEREVAGEIVTMVKKKEPIFLHKKK